MKIIGVDPGTNIMGVAVLENEKLIAIESHSFGKRPRNVRLAAISGLIERYLETCKPDALAIEDQYVGLNKRTSLKLAGAKDIVILEATKKGIPCFEYAPATVKKAVTGYGNAPKSLVALCVQSIVKTNLNGHAYDATDALAVAICHSHRIRKEQYAFTNNCK